ncbi:30S ribosomal protein S7 [Candidatus Woesearchaeota archaeon]|nr:30S ribosomal protein S7 [Candidatus Woesearchaeota archaeon]
MTELKWFNKWDTKEVSVEDLGLKRYIDLKPVLVPRNFGRNSNQRFAKSKSTIIERLMNKVMVAGHKGKKHYRTSGHTTGKGFHVYNTIKECLTLIERETKQNPVKIFIKALENAAPREEITTIEYGGARYPQAVDCAPQRRIDIALRQFTQGAYNKSFGKKKGIANALAEEIIKAYNLDQSSQAISKKLELERQADSSR